ncbi:MAG: hypothetical protein ACK5MW_10075 [Enterococcus sp.]
MSMRLIHTPIMIFLIPFIYFSLLIDVRFNSPTGFFFSLILAGVAGFYFQAHRRLLIWLLGNLSSTGLSLLLITNHPEWHFYYQPYSPTLLVLGLSFLYLIPQIVGIIWAYFLVKQPQNK